MTRLPRIGQRVYYNGVNSRSECNVLRIVQKNTVISISKECHGCGDRCGLDFDVKDFDQKECWDTYCVYGRWLAVRSGVVGYTPTCGFMPLKDIFPVGEEPVNEVNVDRLKALCKGDEKLFKELKEVLSV